tara:strand:+ start:1695 stop:2795 length:1101 start_codon:yes stop_codon:yes gene_type:complete
MITLIFGTRPEIIKLFPIIQIFKKKKINFNLIHTGQHYSNKLNNIFIDQLEIPKKKIYNLKIGSFAHGEQTSLMIIKLEKYIKKYKKKLKSIIVYGDTNSALAGAIAASKFQTVKVIHLESGLRSFDKNMPEEINRRIIDHIADLHLCPTQISKNYLINEGIKKKNIFVTGNTIVDAIRSKIVQTHLKNKKKIFKDKYILLTIHREENTSDKRKFKQILNSVNQISKFFKLKIIFPIHPKTQKLINQIKIKLNSNFKIIEPLNYVDFLFFLKNSILVISDSGGVQEEACILKVPLVTIRNSTERPETIKIKCNILCKPNPNILKLNIKKMLLNRINWKNPYGNGNAAVKSYKIINNFLKKNEKKSY